MATEWFEYDEDNPPATPTGPFFDWRGVEVKVGSLVVNDTGTELRVTEIRPTLEFRWDRKTALWKIRLRCEMTGRACRGWGVTPNKVTWLKEERWIVVPE